jgi:hypothetical protein
MNRFWRKRKRVELEIRDTVKGRKHGFLTSAWRGNKTPINASSSSITPLTLLSGLGRGVNMTERKWPEWGLERRE